MKQAHFEELMSGIRRARRLRRRILKESRAADFRPAFVKAVRLRLKATQAEFALLIGVSVATLRNWEQGRRSPEGPALALLRVAARNPRAVIAALHGSWIRKAKTGTA